MRIEFQRIETHETRYVGSLTGDQVREILMKGIRDQVGAPHTGLRLTLHGLVPSPGQLFPDQSFPDLAFELVHDQDWVLKPDAEEQAPC